MHLQAGQASLGRFKDTIALKAEPISLADHGKYKKVEMSQSKLANNKVWGPS